MFAALMLDRFNQWMSPESRSSLYLRHKSPLTQNKTFLILYLHLHHIPHMSNNQKMSQNQHHCLNLKHLVLKNFYMTHGSTCTILPSEQSKPNRGFSSIYKGCSKPAGTDNEESEVSQITSFGKRIFKAGGMFDFLVSGYV